MNAGPRRNPTSWGINPAESPAQTTPARSQPIRITVIRPALVSTLISLSALASTPQVRFEPASPDVAVPNRWLVELRSTIESPDDTASALVAGKGRVVSIYRRALKGFEADLPDALAESLTASPLVLRVVQDRRFPNALSTPISECSEGVALAGATPSLPEAITCADPEPSNANAVCTDNWGLDRLDGVSVARDGRYNPPRTGQGVHVFMIDTGFYAESQEFTGRVGAGFDATGTDGTHDCGSWSHGTHTAGIAAGTRFGVAKSATIHPVRVATCPTAIQLSFLVAAFDWIAQAHASSITGPGVASMSINSTATDFSDPTSMLNQAIGGMISAGVLLVESAGNDAGDACGHVSKAPGVLVVGGSDALDVPWKRHAGDPGYDAWCTGGGDCGSNTGACVSLFAPAAHIVSSWYGASPDPRNMCRLSGTSMAAPHAAGAAALYLQAHPLATPAQVKAALISQATPVLTSVPAGTTTRLLSVLDPSPRGAASPSSLAFGQVTVDQTSAAQQVTVSSTGSAALNLGASNASGDFVVASNTCGGPLQPGQSCTLSLTFKPTTTGARQGLLTIATDDPAHPSLQVSLTGEGQLGAATLTVVVDGPGAVTSSPPGITCPGSCSASFGAGTGVVLTAWAMPGATFVGWSGAGCEGVATCPVVLAGPVTATARFELAPRGDAGVRASGDAGVRPDAGLMTMTARTDGGTELLVVSGGCGCTSIDGTSLCLGLLVLLRRRRSPL